MSDFLSKLNNVNSYNKHKIVTETLEPKGNFFQKLNKDLDKTKCLDVSIGYKNSNLICKS